MTSTNSVNASEASKSPLQLPRNDGQCLPGSPGSRSRHDSCIPTPSPPLARCRACCRPGRGSRGSGTGRPLPSGAFGIDPSDVDCGSAGGSGFTRRVLVLLHNQDGNLHVIFQERTDKVDAHKGQNSLPARCRRPGRRRPPRHSTARNARRDRRSHPSHIEILGSALAGRTSTPRRWHHLSYAT